MEEKSSYYCEGGELPKWTGPAQSFFGVMAPVWITVMVFMIVRRFKLARKTARRTKFFLMKLQEHQSSNEGVVGRTKLLTCKELYKATDNFNQNRILGRGGQGTVYKGMLVDGTIVAIKKSNVVKDESQMKQFISEVVILSTINHRNVVKLLGICLEEDIPLLVYEFISNGTLSQHIHRPNEGFVLDWAMRLQIAADSAGSVAYLHSSSSTPVYHRDIKTDNILLDDKYRARVSDFGCSRTIEIDQTHITTKCIYGTTGYHDLEYFRSGIFTDKSDVFSFGVVLLELLTSKKANYRDAGEVKGLVMEFFFHVENSNLLELLDPEVVKEAKEEELTAVVDLAKCCLNESGRLRPTMKEVAAKLNMIIKPPTEMSTNDRHASPNEEMREIFMALVNEADIMSSQVPSI